VEALNAILRQESAVAAGLLSHELAHGNVLLARTVEEHGLFPCVGALGTGDAIVHVRTLERLGRFQTGFADLNQVDHVEDAFVGLRIANIAQVCVEGGVVLRGGGRQNGGLLLHVEREDRV
jgi:hypothetical protein